jgi:hypothetical protein
MITGPPDVPRTLQPFNAPLPHSVFSWDNSLPVEDVKTTIPFSAALRLAQLRELRAAVLARRQAELAGLYREREIARARAVERDPAQPLN